MRPGPYSAHIVFFNDTATTEIYTLSLHDALPISTAAPAGAATTAPPWRNVLHSGEEWVIVATPSRTGVAELLPLSHSGPKNFPRRTMQRDPHIGVPRALRLLARREEQAQRPGQVPGRLLVGSGSGQGAGALRRGVGPRHLRTMDRELPLQPEPRQPRAPQADPLLRGELVRRRARLGRARDAEQRAARARRDP